MEAWTLGLERHERHIIRVRGVAEDADPRLPTQRHMGGAEAVHVRELVKRVRAWGAGTAESPDGLLRGHRLVIQQKLLPPLA